MQDLTDNANNVSDIYSYLDTDSRGLLLKKIHAFVCPRSPTNPVCDASHAHLGQHNLHHTIDHRGDISDAQRLFHHSIGYELVGVVDQSEEILALGAYDEGVVHKRGKTSVL